MATDLFSDPVYKSFATQRPIATMMQLTLRRMVQSDLIDRLFEQTAQKQYHRTQAFATLTDLVCSVVLRKNASINAGYKKMSDRLGVSINSVYEKLKRVETHTVEQLVRSSYEETVEVRRQLGGVARHDLAGYTTRILDGNAIGKTQHRLKETRALGAAPLPGKSLVVYDPRFDAVCDYFPIQDGHAQERTGLDQVIETIQAKQLWLADRNFCTLKFLYQIAIRSGFFIIRQHGLLHGTQQGKLKLVGSTETGNIYEHRLLLPAHDGQQITVRRIVVHLFEPTRDGETEVALLSNLPVEDADAMTLSQQYLTRWKIETMFLHITEALRCECDALCYPPAAMFCFACALMGYNSLSIVKGTIAIEKGREISQQLSHYYLALEIAEATDGMLIAIPEERWSLVETLPLETFVAQIRGICESANFKHYAKSTRGPKKPPPKRKNGSKTSHVSVKKILDQRKTAL